MFFTDDNLRNIEITFKMGLKVALHRLFNNQDPVIVNKVFIDNDEQYKGEHGRNINTEEIRRRLILEKRDYVKFFEDFDILPQNSDHNKIEDWQNPNFVP